MNKQRCKHFLITMRVKFLGLISVILIVILTACNNTKNSSQDIFIEKNHTSNSKNTNSVIFEADGDYSLRKDKNNVYFNDEVVKGADAETFKQFYPTTLQLFKDKNKIYAVFMARGELAVLREYENVDVDSFEFLSLRFPFHYAKDKDHVYFNNSRIDKADPNNFQILTFPYSKDKNHVYEQEQIVKGVDSDTFQVLEGHYAKDKQNVYNFGDGNATNIDVDLKTQIVENADPTTFTALNYDEELDSNWYYDAKDKNHFYYRGGTHLMPSHDQNW